MKHLTALLALALLPSAPTAQGGRPAAPRREAGQEAARPLTQEATQALVKAFVSESAWAMKAIVLLSLGHDWHPDGAAMIVSALQDKDPHLRPFALEALRRTEPAALAKAGTPALVAELIEKTSGHKNTLVRTRALEVLRRMLPAAGAADRKAFQDWWSQSKATYAPPAWTPPPEVRGPGGTVAGMLVERAFDLRNAGLELVIVIDSTGSMQGPIDAARDAINDLVTMLVGITPKLRLGLVHYKDLGDMGEGADLLVPLTKDEKKVRERLARLVASGGGDLPEKVDAGIAAALAKETGWTRDANHLILVVGDAPPHPEDEKALLEMVKRAHDHPFAPGKGAVTGAPAKEARPFVTSTIATHQQTKRSFDEIAKAGGGMSALLDLGGGRRGAARAPQGTAAEQLLKHVLLLSFGSGYAATATVFVDTFFESRAAEAF